MVGAYRRRITSSWYLCWNVSLTTCIGRHLNRNIRQYCLSNCLSNCLRRRRSGVRQETNKQNTVTHLITTDWCLYYLCNSNFTMAVPWLRRLVVGLSPRRPGFDPGPVHVKFVVDKVTLGQVLPRVLRFSPVSFIPPVLHCTEKLKKTGNLSLHLHHRVSQ
jgi:hypothetical protein